MTMASIRQWHSYIGFFIAPSVLFFALTGAAQLYSLHEAHGHYQPPAIVEKLSSVHKDQVFALGDHHEPPAVEAGAKGAGESPPPADDDDKTRLSTITLKAFFLLVSLGLTISTLLGLWMGIKLIRRRRIAWGLLIAGALIPLALAVV